MLVTVTPNPSLDLLFEVDELVWNDANRVAPARARPGGQGVNAVRAIRELGGRGLAVLPLGGIVGDQIRRMLEEERTPIRTVDVRAETRVFVGVREHSTGRDLLLNPRGRRLSAAEVDTLAEAALSALGVEARWLACCGSLPAGLPDDFYARLGAEARQLGVKFVPDCDGMPLRLAAAAGCDLLVPNIHEAGRLLNRPVARAGAGAAARALLDFGPTHTCITLGADGAVCATSDGVWQADAPAVVDGSAVGAGDAFLAGVIRALDDEADAPDVLRHGVAVGTAALVGEGAELVSISEVERLSGRVQVRRLDD